MTQQETGTSGADRFDNLADILLELEVFSSPSELHGMLCGKLVSDPDFDEAHWLTSASTFLEQPRLESTSAKQCLLEVFSASLEQLTGPGFELDLVLPDDDEDITVRSESIGRWCGGFLVGFVPGRASGLSEDARESLADLGEIARIEEPLSEGEGHEQDLMEIVEYVRMVVIMLFSELHAQGSGGPMAGQDPGQAPPIH